MQDRAGILSSWRELEAHNRVAAGQAGLECVKSELFGELVPLCFDLITIFRIEYLQEEDGPELRSSWKF